MINGNIEGVRNSCLNELESIYKIKTLKDEAVNEEIINIMVNVSTILEREVSVAIDRKGKVYSVAVGDSTSVECK